jgi:hypothetical protein
VSERVGEAGSEGIIMMTMYAMMLHYVVMNGSVPESSVRVYKIVYRTCSILTTVAVM